MPCSIILPVYNSELHLFDCLSSVISQSYENFELIVINDGSTDNSLEILRYFEQLDHRVNIFTTKNHGLVNALNLGLEKCSNELIARLDSDDLMHPERLEAQITFLEKNKDVAVVGSWVQLIGAKTGKYKYFKTHASIELSLKYTMGSGLAHPSVMFDRQRISELRYRDKYLHAEDIDLWVRLLNQGVKFANIPKCLTYYRIHSENVSKLHNGLQTDNRRKLLLNPTKLQKSKCLYNSLVLKLSKES